VDKENLLAMLAFKSATKGLPTVFWIFSAVMVTLVQAINIIKKLLYPVCC
jgi:hypothetical protein